jgi:hypothetical protein
MPHVFERDGRAPSETVEAFVEFLEPRQTCGAVDVASGQGPWARRPVGAPPGGRAARALQSGSRGSGRGSGSGASSALAGPAHSWPRPREQWAENLAL